MPLTLCNVMTFSGASLVSMLSISGVYISLQPVPVGQPHVWMRSSPQGCSSDWVNSLLLIPYIIMWAQILKSICVSASLGNQGV